jgi:protein FAM50
VVESIDDRLKKSTVGLVTLSDFQKTREGLEEEQRQVAAQSSKRQVTIIQQAAECWS